MKHWNTAKMSTNTKRTNTNNHSHKYMHLITWTKECMHAYTPIYQKQKYKLKKNTHN